MGNDRGNYRKSILELVLVTAIFAVVSVLILKIYLTADRLQAEAAAISTATIQAESIAESVKLFGVDVAAEKFDMEEEEGYFVLRYDKNWKRTVQEEKYQIVLAVKEVKDGITYAFVYAGKEELLEHLKAKDAGTDHLLCALDIAVYEEK